MNKAVLLVLVALFAVALGFKSYEGYNVVKVAITTDEQADQINQLNLDIWSGDGTANVGIHDILVSPDQLKQLIKIGVTYTVSNDHIGADIESERVRLSTRPSLNIDFSNFTGTASPFFNDYHTAVEIVDYISLLASSFPALVKYTPSIGTTVQGRSIPSLIITGPLTGSKKKIFIQGGQHAREWVGPTTVLLIAESLVTLYATDPVVKGLMDRIEFHIVPLLNVDGYVYAWTNDRLWRKNRRANQGGSFGVDLNRNWNGNFWCQLGASTNPTSDTYCGTAIFSEPETKASSTWSTANGPYASSIDYHSYSQLVLRPWGYTTTAPTDDAQLKTVGDGYSATIRSFSGFAYTSQPSWALYYTTGTASDYWRDFENVKYSYTVELRPIANNPGFVLPPRDIVPTGEENWAAFKYFADITTR